MILDLLPLYLAGEFSEETAALVKEYLESDPEMAESAKEMEKDDSLSKKTGMKTDQEAKKWMTIRILGLATIVGLVIMCFLVIDVVFAVT